MPSTYRDTTHESIQKFGQVWADDLIRLNFPGQDPKVKMTFPKEAMAAIQAEHMLNPDTILRMARDLDRHFWVVGINSTGHPLYTSDHPVVRRANRHDSFGPLVGVRDPGVEFAFPLDSTHLLLILERTHFKAWRKCDGGTFQMPVEQVRDYNGLQVRKSNQRVYCANDDFDLAREICKAEPAICDPNRPRTKSGSTPYVKEGTKLKNYAYVIHLE